MVNFDPAMFVGKTVAEATCETGPGGGVGDVRDVLSLRFTDGSSVTITTADTEEYCSWMEFEAVEGP